MPLFGRTFDLGAFASAHPEFHEEHYLAANADVAAAVRAGHISSGAEHYWLFGFHENRPLKGVEDAAATAPSSDRPPRHPRNEKLLAGLRLRDLVGLEIGALDVPFVTRNDGIIIYVDHVDTEALKAKYRFDKAVNVDSIVDIDAVWGESSLQDCIGADRKVDYVVASHVIEHVPDVVTWLSEIHAVLASSGTLRLAIPDRRYTFDILRCESRIHDVLDAYLRKARSPMPRHIIEHFSSMRAVDCVAAWNGTLDLDTLSPCASVTTAFEFGRNAYLTGTYVDAHCWVFTPRSFADLCCQLAEMDLLSFKCAQYYDTARNELEFFVHMDPSGVKSEIVASWQNMKASARV
jgi:Methyltransferase domain